jgi:hypothetical protein
MKNLKIIAIALVSVFSFSSCSNDDPIVNEGRSDHNGNHNFDCRKPDGNLDF